MTRTDLQIHADLIGRVIERNKQSVDANPVVQQVLAQLQQEYLAAHEIMPVEQE